MWTPLMAGDDEPAGDKSFLSKLTGMLKTGADKAAPVAKKAASTAGEGAKKGYGWAAPRIKKGAGFVVGKVKSLLGNRDKPEGDG